MRLFVIIADEFNVYKIGISIGLILVDKSRGSNSSVIKTYGLHIPGTYARGK